jgi:hypothetical protein
VNAATPINNVAIMENRAINQGLSVPLAARQCDRLKHEDYGVERAAQPQPLAAGGPRLVVAGRARTPA